MDTYECRHGRGEVPCMVCRNTASVSNSRLIDGLYLKLRNAIADKEWNIAGANMHTATNGRWLVNWHEGIEEADKTIKECLKQLKI